MYRCGIKTCKKCFIFSYYSRMKQNCLWDEWHLRVSWIYEFVPFVVLFILRISQLVVRKKKPKNHVKTRAYRCSVSEIYNFALYFHRNAKSWYYCVSNLFINFAFRTVRHSLPRLLNHSVLFLFLFFSLWKLFGRLKRETISNHNEDS